MLQLTWPEAPLCETSSSVATLVEQTDKALAALASTREAMEDASRGAFAFLENASKSVDLSEALTRISATLARVETQLDVALTRDADTRIMLADVRSSMHQSALPLPLYMG